VVKVVEFTEERRGEGGGVATPYTLYSLHFPSLRLFWAISTTGHDIRRYRCRCMCNIMSCKYSQTEIKRGNDKIKNDRYAFIERNHTARIILWYINRRVPLKCARRRQWRSMLSKRLCSSAAAATLTE